MLKNYKYLKLNLNNFGTLDDYFFRFITGSVDHYNLSYVNLTCTLNRHKAIFVLLCFVFFFHFQGQVLLKRLLYTNAKRVKQTETLNPVWIDSVLQLRFQGENTQLEIQD